MPKPKSHSSQLVHIESSDGSVSFRRQTLPRALISSRHPRGPHASVDLLTWISTTKSEASARITEILELILELADLSRGNGNEKKQVFCFQGRVFKARANLRVEVPPNETARERELASKLNLRMRRYQFAPWYSGTIGEYPILGWWSGKNRPRDEDDREEDVWFTEEDAIIAILDLARAGQLRDIRRCYCGDWFLARFTHQKFCCLRCQQRYYRSSEEYKAMRRTYMKDLRKLHKKTYFVSPKATGKNQEKESLPC